MTEPIDNDERVRSEDPAEGAIHPGEPGPDRQHSQDPAEGVDAEEQNPAESVDPEGPDLQ